MKFLKWKMNEKVVAIIAIFCFVIVCLLPLLMIAKYNHPCADDYGYGYEAHMAWKTTHSLVETFRAAIQTVHTNYYAWQGTFASIFLMALTPAAFGEQYYAAVPYLMLGMLTVAVFYCAKVFLHDLLKASYANSIIVAVVLLFMMIEGIYTPASAFFWYNSAIHYTFMHAMMLLMTAFFVKSLTAEKKVVSVVCCVFASLCAFCVSGGNYLNALVGILLLAGVACTFSLTTFSQIIKRKKAGESVERNTYRFIGLILLPIIIYSIGFFISISAPGNSVRGANFAYVAPLTAVLRSFVSGFRHCIDWMSLFTFILLILLLPAIWGIVRETEYEFRYSLLVLVFSFCLFSASFTSSHYGLGGEGLPRTFNSSKMLYHILLVANELYLVGRIQKKLKKAKREKVRTFNISHSIIFYLVVSMMLAGVFLTCNDKEANYPSYASVKYMREGFALHYHMQYLERITILNGTESTVYLKEIEPKLNVLYVDDITTDSSDWRNQQYAKWHQKEAVILIPTQK